ncbi:MAG TPA: 1-deoxy-D-xylulose-5-phosphate reductoisomerase [Candidatus Sulfotelmatobacter sp.]|nr:1-deoxy-D-xylulose-5-phosphate reductoisomerase [Candidatus Sulfotelmatobacter sp.]
MSDSSFGSRRRVVLLGATGSIGRQACDVIARFPERFQLVGAVAGRDVAALADVVARFEVPHSALVQPTPGTALPTGCGVGLEAACEVAAQPADVVCVAITGAAALRPTLAALEAGSDIAITTKEVLVMAGELVRATARRTGARLFPVDSEHSALWQCLRGEAPEAVSRLVLTASGGPFRDRDLLTFGAITPAEALRHPNWNMGPKVTVDSATMMNKGLEVIEAHFLFDIPYSRIAVVIHPESIVHSVVEFRDGATMAQLGIPDMRVPIALALSGGERLPGVCPPVDVTQKSLHFRAVDHERFPAVQVARQAGESGGVAPCALNAANEVAVAAFLEERCRFDQIVPLVETAVRSVTPRRGLTLTDILETDQWAREEVERRLAPAGARVS